MNNFTYRTNEEKENLEAILRQRQRKFNTQQWVARGIMLFIAISVFLYAANHTYYTTFDGYVSVDQNKVRAPFDIYLDSIFVHTGDIVYPGDTLYSYYAMSTMIEAANPNREIEVVSSNRSLVIKQQEALRQISVLKVQIAELQKQIALENHNISLGLSSNSHRLDLERQLKEAQAKLRSLQNEYYMYGNIINDMPTYMVNNRHNSTMMIFDNLRSGLTHAGVAYNICSDSAIIVNVLSPSHTILFQKEDIITSQHLNLESNNLGIIAYVPVEKMHRITLDTHAEIKVNEEFVFTAKVTALGLRTEEIPEQLRSYFAKKNTAIIAGLEIDPGQQLPFWCLASGLPVDIRIKNSDTWRVKTHDKNYLWYVTGKGVSKGFPNIDSIGETIDMVDTKPKVVPDTVPSDSLTPATAPATTAKPAATKPAATATSAAAKPAATKPATAAK